MKITPIPCLSDNYAYLVECEETGATAVVDPSEAAPVIKALDLARMKPVAIWNTHHHMDHVGGNEEVRAKYSVPEIYAYATDKGRIPGQTQFLEDGQTFKLGNLQVKALHIPGHTLGAVLYVVENAKGEKAVFTGDTLFLAGCGRLFEGSPAQMHASLTTIAAQGKDAQIYCGHEYTESNLRFAAHCEPSNKKIAEVQSEVSAARQAGRPSVPWTVARDVEVNPFQRVDSPEIRATLGIDPSADGDAALGAIRKAKDNFK